MLSNISPSRVTQYMETRLAEKDACGRTINMQLGILASAMGFWPRVKKLEENLDVGRALESAEEKAILDAAVRNQSPLIYPFLYSGLDRHEER